MHRDFSRRSPSEAFELIFRRSAPPDVAQLTAAGEVSLGGSKVWLRFRATSQTIQGPTAGMDQTAAWIQGEDMKRDDPSSLSRNQVLSRTRWNQVSGWKPERRNAAITSPHS